MAVPSRVHGRQLHELRPVKITYNAFGYATGSVLFELGNTKVLCSVSLQQGVPPFLKGKKEGWLTAEYSLLPTSTTTRSPREGAQQKRNDRAIEISRLIGRVLRAITNLPSLGERTILVDCDVLQADGSTRTAAVTGAYLALQQAMNIWLGTGEIQIPFITEPIAAVSVGLAGSIAMLDLDYQEDSTLDADYNVVLAASGKIIEIQGTAEKNPISWEHFDSMMQVARAGVSNLFEIVQKQAVAERSVNTKKIALFSLQARFKTTGA